MPSPRPSTSLLSSSRLFVGSPPSSSSSSPHSTASSPMRLPLTGSSMKSFKAGFTTSSTLSSFLRLFSITTAFIMVCLYFASVTHLTALSPPAVDRWLQDQRTTGELLLRRGLRARRCLVVAMVLASDQDVANGSMTDWWKTVPPYHSPSPSSSGAYDDNSNNRVCCVYIRRSPDVRVRYSYAEEEDTCDTMFVPMVRPDEYLTISEKVVLALKYINSMYDFDWLLKTDTDSYVCFTRLLELVRNFDPAGIVHLGYAESRNILLEDPRHRWYDPSITDIVHNGRQRVVSGVGLYHPYMQGAGYVLSQGAVAQLERSIPNLRYSPMEDAMLGSWLLALNTHYAVLDLDLRAERAQCNMPPHLVISHERKGRAAFDECRMAHPECTRVERLAARPLDRVSFVVTGDFGRRANQCMDAYNAIRAMFPRAEVVFGDASSSTSSGSGSAGRNRVLHRLIQTARDPLLRGVWVPDGSMASVRNRAVAATTGEFVVMLNDQQRVSWETMIGRMVEKVASGEAEVVGGFLKFNPHMNESGVGLAANGYRARVRDGTLWKEDVVDVGNWRAPNATLQVDATTGFLLARRELLVQNEWRDFGRFIDDEWHMRVRATGARMVVVNSGVRHGYHYELDKDEVEAQQEVVGSHARLLCKTIASAKLKAMAGRHGRLDCTKRMWRLNAGNQTTYARWS